MNDKCYFRVDDVHGIFKRCNALVVGKCKNQKCKFRKTEQEYEAGIKNAKKRLKDLGLVAVDTYTETGERIMTTERKRV